MIICIMIVVVVYIQEGTAAKQSHPPAMTEAACTCGLKPLCVMRI